MNKYLIILEHLPRLGQVIGSRKPRLNFKNQCKLIPYILVNKSTDVSRKKDFFSGKNQTTLEKKLFWIKIYLRPFPIIPLQSGLSNP